MSKAKNKPSDLVGTLQGMSVAVSMPDVGAIPTRCYALNLVLGGRGIARGQVVEVCGVPGCGKSTFLYEMLSIAAGQGAVAMLFDQEHCAFPNRLLKFGLVAGYNLVYDRGLYIEDIFDRLMAKLAIIPPDQPVVVGLDSAGICTCRRNYERAEEGKGSQQGQIAAAWWEEQRQLFSRTGERDLTIIILNHMIADFAHTTAKYQARTTPGGGAIKYMAATRIEMFPGKHITNDYGTPVGVEVHVKTLKNKIAPPFKSTKVPLYFGNPELPPEQDYAGTYDPQASLWFLKDAVIYRPTGKPHNAVRNTSSWSMVDLADPDTGEMLLKDEELQTLHGLKWQGEAAFCHEFFPQHKPLIYRLMHSLYFQAGTWDAGLGLIRHAGVA